VSIVSHGHGAHVENLLRQIDKWNTHALKLVIITINAPALDADYFNDIAFQFTFKLCIVKNQQPLGFGANHNRAFTLCSSDYYLVINPDLDFPQNPFPNILKNLEDDCIGCAYPVQSSGQNLLLDFERELASPTSILKRHIPLFKISKPISLDIDWVSGAFMALSATAFRKIGGFDERYFMYCEDVDICLRLQLSGYRLSRADVTVIHHTQRKTLKNLRHLAWHVRSLLRLWNSTAYQEYKRKFIEN
jgi:N-acetylglucosaminyl-diphospho-decaprenol L-rhamnosyltransferase